MRSAVGLLQQAWFRPMPALRLAILRVLAGGFALWFLAARSEMLWRIGQAEPSLYSPVGLARLFAGPPGPSLVAALLLATAACNLAFLFGWHFRVTGPLFGLLLLTLLSYRNSWSMIYHSENLLVLHVLVLACSAAADRFSLDALRNQGGREGAPAGGWQYGWPIRLLCAVTATSYFLAGVAKVAGPLGWSWAEGESLCRQVAVNLVRKELLAGEGSPWAGLLLGAPWLFSVLGVATLLLELAAPLALWRRGGRAWALGMLGLHWGVLLVMGIRFEYQLAGLAFASFFDGERLLPAGLCRLRELYSQ